MSEFKVGDRVRLICCRKYGTIIKEKEMFGTRLHYTILFDYDETDCLVPEEDLEIVDEHGKTLLEQRIEKLEKCVMGEQKPIAKLFTLDRKEPLEIILGESNEETKSSLLTEDERVILRNLDKKYKYIARDSIGYLFVHSSKPKKEYEVWCSDDVSESFIVFEHLFQFIKWTDKEPYNIEELLKGESEE